MSEETAINDRSRFMRDDGWCLVHKVPNHYPHLRCSESVDSADWCRWVRDNPNGIAHQPKRSQP